MEIRSKQSFLEQYFILVCQFSHNKAKDLIDKEIEENTKAPLLWTSFLNLLGNLATCEKNIYSLNFLASNTRKLFWKKDTLINMYGTVLSELEKMRSVFSERDLVETFIIKLVSELQHLIQIRINIMNFYQQIFSQNNGRNINMADYLGNIESALSLLDNFDFHFILIQFKALMKTECECVMYLLKTEMAIQKCNYIDSLLNLLTVSSKLATWHSMRLSGENRKLPLLSHKSLPLELLEWMNKYKLILLAKFNLYFYNTLSAQSNSNDIKSILANNQFDFYSRIIGIQKKLDAQVIVLLFNNPDGYISELSYKMPQAQTTMKGVNFFFCHPPDKHDKFMNVILQNFREKYVELKSSDKIITSTDEKLQLSIIYNWIDEYSSIALVLNKKTKMDAYNLSMITTFTTDLKCNKLYLLFKAK